MKTTLLVFPCLLGCTSLYVGISTTELERCGNGLIEPELGELCDDGNSAPNDTCDAACQTVLCGNLVVQPLLGEECDDGNDNNQDGCLSDCRLLRSYNVQFGNSFDLADINRDGIDDIVTEVDVLIGTGDGTFVPTEALGSLEDPELPEENSFVRNIVLADLNQDDRADIVAIRTPENEAQSELHLIFGNGDGTFREATQHIEAIDAVAVALEVVDLTGDNKPEIVVVGQNFNASGGQVSIFLNDGSGFYTDHYSIPFVETPVESIVVGDFNTDGNIDVFLGFFNKQLLPLFGSGTGGFLFAEPITMSDSAFGFASGDMNHDGKLDLLVPQSNGVDILLGTGEGGFSEGVTVGVPSVPNSILVDDCNNDGFDDILFGDTSIGMTLLAGDGTLEFEIHAIPLAALKIRSGDLNQDGRSDLVTSVTRTLQVVFGQGDSEFQ